MLLETKLIVGSIYCYRYLYTSSDENVIMPYIGNTFNELVIIKANFHE